MAWVTPSLLLTAAIVGAGLGTAASGITSLVNGVYPWDDPLGYLKGDLMGGAIGGATGAVTAGAGAALGPVLGAAADTIGVGANVGTTAVEAGAMTPTALGGTISSTAGQVLSNAGEQASQVSIGNIAKDVLVNAGVGAAKSPDDPLRGAAMGAAGGVVQGGLNYAGQTTGLFSPGPSREISFKYQPDAQHYSVAGQQLASSPATMVSSMQAPGFGDRIGMAGSRFAGNAARTGVGAAMAPKPPTPEPTLYEPWRRIPYWQRGLQA